MQTGAGADYNAPKDYSAEYNAPMGPTSKACEAKAYNTCIAPQAAYRSCSGAVHVTDRAGVQPIDRRLSLRPQTDL